MKKTSKKYIYIIIAVAALALLTAVLFSWMGTAELTQFNSRSIMDWRLGAKIEAVDCEEDAKAFDPTHFEWFEDEYGSGIKNTSTGARYYLGQYPDSGFGKYCVTGFISEEQSYSVMDIRVGDSELDAKTFLMDNGYSMSSGGFNSCKASNGDVTVTLTFEHGVVTHIGAFLNPTHIFG